MFVIGTAGHVDHGKSTLVRALTGIDPDRLREEKERGLTIELGFAWLTLPSGREVSIVDVPGHERFIKNMLMGVGGIDVALLVVAADEGVMPQTREHLAIIDLLQVRKGVVAITKCDLADEDLLAIVEEDIDELLDGTSIEGSSVVPVSAERGTGLDELRSALDEAIDSADERRDLGRPRVPVDRSFTISGFGTVVTGTLADGRLRPGQEVEILPSAKRARIRGLQSHEQPVDAALPGSRVAVNLSGVDHAEVVRGDIITTPGWLKSTSVFDAAFRAIPGAPRPVRHNHRVTVFAGTREVEGTLRVLEGDEIAPGSEGWVQLKLDAPAPIVTGDRFVVRDSNDTLGGGRVLELLPKRHRRNDPATIHRLESLAAGGGDDAILAVIERNEPTTIAALGRAANISEAEADSAVASLVDSGLAKRVGGGLLFTTQRWQRVQADAVATLEEFHSRYPLRPGLQREELRGRLRLKASDYAAVLDELQASQVVSLSGSLVALPGHEVHPSASQEKEIADFKAALASSRFTPPTTRIDPELLQLLILRGEVVKAADDVVYLTDAYREMTEGLVKHARQNGEISIEDVRNIYGTSRKYTLAVLAQMDRDNITLRRGDIRVLKR